MVRYDDHLLPSWALEVLGEGERVRAHDQRAAGELRVRWSDGHRARSWSKRNGWRSSWLRPDQVFLDAVLADDEAFTTAVRSDAVDFLVPRSDYSLTPAAIEQMDVDYADRSSWGSLVETLRTIRRAIESGVIVHADGRKLDGWSDFYEWAHGRYHLLEDGHDAWIGDDRS